MVRKIKIFASLFVASTALLIGAATAQTVNETWPSRPIRSFLYGERTVIEWSGGPAVQSITDAAGDPLPYDRQGQYYRIDVPLDSFIIQTATAKYFFSKFKLTKIDAANLAAPVVLPLPAPAPELKAANTAAPAAIEAKAPPQPSAPARTVNGVMSAEVEEMQKQLRDLKDALKAAAGSPNADRRQLHAVVDQINDLNGKLATKSLKTIAFTFEPRKTTIDTASAKAKSLIPAANAAERINIRGYTESDIDSPRFAAIALERASNVKKFLIENGVPAEKITVAGRGSGGFVADNSTEAGRAKNRRVEIELVESGLKLHAMEVTKK